jgi:hypothetical protein
VLTGVFRTAGVGVRWGYAAREEKEGSRMDTSLTRELRFALDAYIDAHTQWKTVVKDLARQKKARGQGSSTSDPTNERHMYLLARKLYLEMEPGEGASQEIIQRARRYITEVNRLAATLNTLSQHLETISEVPESENFS